MSSSPSQYYNSLLNNNLKGFISLADTALQVNYVLFQPPPLHHPKKKGRKATTTIKKQTPYNKKKKTNEVKF